MLDEFGDLAKLKMVTELDAALHGETVARGQSPKEVWESLLGKVRMMADTTRVTGRPHQSLERDIEHALNYWGVDSDLNTPDFILANHLYRHLMDLKQMLEATAKWRGEE